MPSAVAEHVSAVVLFAKPWERVMRFLGDPAVTVGPRYAPVALEPCVDNDLICDDDGSSFAAHDSYAEAGLTQRGAAFAATNLISNWAAAAAESPDPIPRTEGAPRLPGPVLLAPQLVSPPTSPTGTPSERADAVITRRGLAGSGS